MTELVLRSWQRGAPVEVVRVGDSMWPRELSSKIREVEHHVAELDREVARLDAMVARWAPLPLRTVGGVDGHGGGGSSFKSALNFGGTTAGKKAGSGQITISHEPLPLPGPECSNYASLYDAGRKVGNPKPGGLKCDDQLVAGWYRFVGDAGTHMPESPPPIYSCSTHAPGWLASAHPSVADGVQDATVCYAWKDANNVSVPLLAADDDSGA